MRIRLYVSTGPVGRSRHAATGKELFFVNIFLSSRDDCCTANAGIIGKGLFQVYWCFIFLWAYITLGTYLLSAIFNAINSLSQRQLSLIGCPLQRLSSVPCEVLASPPSILSRHFRCFLPLVARFNCKSTFLFSSGTMSMTSSI